MSDVAIKLRTFGLCLGMGHYSVYQSLATFNVISSYRYLQFQYETKFKGKTCYEMIYFELRIFTIMY